MKKTQKEQKEHKEHKEHKEQTNQFNQDNTKKTSRTIDPKQTRNVTTKMARATIGCHEKSNSARINRFTFAVCVARQKLQHCPTPTVDDSPYRCVSVGNTVECGVNQSPPQGWACDWYGAGGATGSEWR